MERPFFMLSFSRVQCLLPIGEAIGLAKAKTVFRVEDRIISEFLV